MPEVIFFPENILLAKTHSWNLVGMGVGPGQTASGVYPYVRLDGGGAWTLKLERVRLLTTASVLTWRAVRTLANGGSTPIVVPRRDKLYAPFPVVGGQRITDYADQLWADDVLFDDDTGWSQSVIDASVTESALLRATGMTIRFIFGGPLQGGESFSIYHPTEGWRLYEIGTVTIDGAGDSVITFLPPLREAVDAGTTVEFDNPRCTMRLADPRAMDLPLESYPRGEPSASFVETFFNT